MDNRIPLTRPDVVAVASAARPTPTPVRVPFSQVLAGGARTLVRGAEAAASVLPGGPLVALALRQAGSVGGAPSGQHAPGVTSAASPEGPGATGGAGVGSEAGVESSLAQAQEMNMYYLQIQESVNAQNRSFSTLSNVLKAEHDTVKTAIGNIR